MNRVAILQGRGALVHVHDPPRYGRETPESRGKWRDFQSRGCTTLGDEVWP